MKLYAGIGSRETPFPVLQQMQEWGNWFARSGLVLRSGHARGADQAFELGCDSALPGHQAKQIFTADMSNRYPNWFDHAAAFHPAWPKCSPYAQALHARNSAIVLGAQLNDPVTFVCCWTKGGKASGGTGQALRIAAHCEIPVFNFQSDPDMVKLREQIEGWIA